MTPTSTDPASSVAPPLLPTAMLVGPGRTGTTSLFSCLSHHPEIVTSRHKETQIFRAAVLGEAIDVGRYFHEFGSETCRPCRLEASPSYFQGGSIIAEAIRHHCGVVKIVVTLRDPSKRLLSNFLHVRSKVLFNASYQFDEYAARLIQVQDRGILQHDDFNFSGLIESDYHGHLADWVSVFGASNVLVCFFEDFVDNPRQTLAAVLRHLQVSEDHVRALRLPDTNKSQDIRLPRLHKSAVSLANALEPTLRAMPQLKRVLQRAYYRSNGGQRSDLSRLEAATRQLVVSRCQSLRYLGRSLRDCRLATSPPSWVSELKLQHE